MTESAYSVYDKSGTISSFQSRPENQPHLKEPSSWLGVVIPTHNCEIAIGSQVLLARQYAAHVIVVDDFSDDRTVEVATQAGAEVINTGSLGRGKIHLVLAGAKRAVERGCLGVVLLDSGGSHLTRDIPRLAAPVLFGSADLVIGSRNLTRRQNFLPFLGESPDTTNSSHSVTGNFLNTDPDSPFRALSIRAITLLDQIPDTDTMESAMVSVFLKQGLNLKEIRVKLRSDPTEWLDSEIPLYRGKKIGVVVPAHNEQLLIGETLAGIPDYVARIYVVNDASTDNTQEIVEKFASKDKSIIPILHEKNKGVGAAIVTGYKRGIEDGMDILAVMAGDNQMDPAFLPELLDPIVDKKCDYTMGNRLVSPNFRKGMTKWRFFGNSILTLLTKIASGYWQMVDPQNGYTAISKRALERISLDDIYPRYGYCNDVLVKLNVLGFRVINVPHPARYGREKSGIRYSTYILKLSRLLLNDFLWRLKMKYVVLGFHPLVFFYVFGAFFGLIGIGGLAYSLYYKFIMGNPIFVPVAVSLVMFGIGIQCLFFAMSFDMQQEKNSNGWYA
jgi:glycosyltransferase involved in cell wall biosynthesis